MSQTIRENLDIIRNITNKMPKTITEAMEFDEEIPMDEPLHDMPEDKPIDFGPEPEMKEPEKPVAGPEAARSLIDDIRKKALRAMAELADTPDCPEYENLKRIWQLCDKAANGDKQSVSKSEEV